MTHRQRCSSPSPCPTILPGESRSPRTIPWSDITNEHIREVMELADEVETIQDSAAVPVCRICKRQIWPVHSIFCHYKDSETVIMHLWCSLAYWYVDQ